MTSGTAALLSVGFLLVLTQGAPTNKEEASLPIRLSVENDLFSTIPEFYQTSVAEGGVLLGALRRLQEMQRGFKFTVKEDPDFGLLIESVNGVAGDKQAQTYWEILSESSGVHSRLDVGVSCYRPKADEHIILRFNTWKPRM
ncbi:unnamed protein product [Ophioblennius macclurei]